MSSAARAFTISLIVATLTLSASCRSVAESVLVVDGAALCVQPNAVDVTNRIESSSARYLWCFMLLRNSAGGSESSCATRGLVEIRGPRRFGRNDLFDDQLANLTSGRQFDRLVTSVIEQTTNFTSIIRIDHACECIESFLRGQSRSWRNPPI